MREEKGSKDKHLCKLKKSLLKEGDIEGYLEYIREPKYLCRKCGRMGNSKDNICKPYDL